jgi:hypothetical protein
MTAKQSKADRAIDLISQIEEDTRKATIAELASDLADFLKVAPADEGQGYEGRDRDSEDQLLAGRAGPAEGDGPALHSREAIMNMPEPEELPERLAKLASIYPTPAERLAKRLRSLVAEWRKEADTLTAVSARATLNMAARRVELILEDLNLKAVPIKGTALRPANDVNGHARVRVQPRFQLDVRRARSCLGPRPV